MYAVASVDATGSACEELGYELEMHSWQAELARVKLVEMLSSSSERAHERVHARGRSRKLPRPWQTSASC